MARYLARSPGATLVPMPRRPGRPSPVPPTLPRVHLARDHTATDIAAAVRTGVWLRVRPGVYVDAGEARDPRAMARARIAAIRDGLSSAYIVSHASAALLWGLPIVGAPTQVHVISPWNPSRGDARGVVRHVYDVPPAERVDRFGIAVTTLERTVVDCAMWLGPRWGLVVADAALHAGASREGCRQIVQRMRGRRGVVAARAVVDLADDGAESAGESLARYELLRAGLPVPQTQVPVETRTGTYWSDLGWPDWKVLAEYDGRGKYEVGGSTAGPMMAEKARQAAIEECGYRVLRVVSEDLRQPDRLVARVLRAAPGGGLGGLVARPALQPRRVGRT